MRIVRRRPDGPAAGTRGTSEGPRRRPAIAPPAETAGPARPPTADHGLQRAARLGHNLATVPRRAQRVLQDKHGGNLWPTLIGLASWQSLGESAKSMLANFHQEAKVYTFNSATAAMDAARKAVAAFEGESKASPEGMPMVDLSTSGPNRDFKRYVDRTEEQAIQQIQASGHGAKVALEQEVRQAADKARYWADKADYTQLGTTGLNERPHTATWQTGTPPTTIKAPDYIQHYLRKIWEKVQTAQGGGVVPKATLPQWGGQAHDGQGTWSEVWFSPDRSWPRGSSPGGDLGGGAAWERTAFHAGIPGGTPLGKSTLYIRGHLLNDHLGGPGLPYNLVALAGHAGPDTANANARHHTEVEEALKNVVSTMLAWGGRSPSKEQPLAVVYRIEAVWGNHARSNTGIVDTAAQMVDVISKNLAYWGLAPTATVQDLWDRLVNGNGGADKKYWDYVHDAVNAVCDHRVRGEMTVTRLAALMQRNAQLWRWEDANVPLRLQGTIDVERPSKGGTTKASTPFAVSNDLPNVATRPFVRQWLV